MYCVKLSRLVNCQIKLIYVKIREKKKQFNSIFCEEKNFNCSNTGGLSNLWLLNISLQMSHGKFKENTSTTATKKETRKNKETQWIFIQ